MATICRNGALLISFWANLSNMTEYVPEHIHDWPVRGSVRQSEVLQDCRLSLSRNPGANELQARTNQIDLHCSS